MSMNFPNNADYVSATQTFNFMDTLGTLTIWLKAPASAGVALLELLGSFTQYIYVSYPAAGDISYVDGSGFTNYGSGGFVAGAWTHVALRRSANTVLNVMVGGSTTGTDARDQSADFSNIMEIGSIAAATGASLCQCRMWNTNLSDAEVVAEMNSATHVKTANLFVDWPMANGTDTSDASGNGRTLTLNGTPTTDASNPSQGGGGLVGVMWLK